MVESVKEVRKICYKGEYFFRAWYNKYVSKVSIYVTWLLLHTKVTANTVTIFEFFLVIISSIFLFFGNLWFIFVGMLIIQFSNLLDCVDGEIARYRKSPSLVGVHQENIYHQLVSYLMFFPLAFGIFLQTGWKSILIFGFLCSILSKSIAIPNMYSAIIESRLGKVTPLGYLRQKKGTNKKIQNINLQGSEIGKKLSRLYNRFKDFWAAPTNMLQLTVISIIELVNLSYHFMPRYILFYWYLLVYAIAMVFIQTISVVIHYKGKAAEQYYKALFGDE